jgi:hypothetical protein
LSHTIWAHLQEDFLHAYAGSPDILYHPINSFNHQVYTSSIMFHLTQLLRDSLQPTQVSAIRSCYWENQFFSWLYKWACMYIHTPPTLWACLTWHYNHNQHDNSFHSAYWHTTYFLLWLLPSMNWPNTCFQRKL